MTPTHCRIDRTANSHLPSLGFVLDPSYFQSVRQEPLVRTNSTTFEWDDDHTFIYQPSSPTSTAISREGETDGDADTEARVVKVKSGAVRPFLKRFSVAIKSLFAAAVQA